MFSRCSTELGHGAFRQTRPVGRACVKRGHAAATPSEDRFKLSNRGAAVRSAGRADLAHTMRGFRDARSVAGIAEQIPEGLFRQRPAALTADKGKVTAWAGSKDSIKRRQDWKDDRDPGLFGPERRDTVADVLAPRHTASPRRKPV